VNELKLSTDSLNEFRRLIDQPAFRRIEQQQQASNWRNEVHADWLDNFMKRIRPTSDSSVVVNAKTGKPHTVESMVSELKERVKLDSITKTAAQFPLFIATASEEDAEEPEDELSEQERGEKLEKIREFVENMFSSHRGYVDTPAIIYECRDRFGVDTVVEFKDEIEEIIEESKKHFLHNVSTPLLPSSYTGQPQTANSAGNEAYPLFENIKNI